MLGLLLVDVGDDCEDGFEASLGEPSLREAVAAEVAAVAADVAAAIDVVLLYCAWVAACDGCGVVD